MQTLEAERPRHAGDRSAGRGSTVAVDGGRPVVAGLFLSLALSGCLNPDPDEVYVGVRTVPARWLHRTRVDEAFVEDGQGGEFVLHWEMLHGAFNSLTLATVPFRVRGLDVAARETRADLGYAMYFHGDGFDRGKRRCATFVEDGFSLLRLEIDGSEPDAIALGVFGRLGLLVRLVGNLEFEAQAEVHAWGGADSKGLMAASAASVSMGLAVFFFF